MASGALLFVQDSFVSLLVVVVVLVMLYATFRSISESRRRTSDEERRADAQPYLSSSSDPQGYEVRSVAVPQTSSVPSTPPADDSDPVDMTLYDPDAYSETARTNLAIATY